MYFRQELLKPGQVRFSTSQSQLLHRDETLPEDEAAIGGETERFCVVDLPSRRDHCGGSDPRRGGVSGGPKGGPLTPPRCRTSGQKGGVAPSISTPPRAARLGEGGRARCSLASPCRRRRGKCSLFRVQCRVSGKCQTTTARTPSSEREALWWSKACATYVSHQVFFSGALIRRHRLDPQRR